MLPAMWVGAMSVMKIRIQKMTRSIVIALAVLSLVGIGYWYFKGDVDKPAMITAMPVRMDLEEAVLASGMIHAQNTVEVGAQVSGQLQRLHVGLGDRVTKGQLLAEIDPQQQQNALKNARAGLANVHAQKRAREALLRQYQLELIRQKRMRGQDASAQADLEVAEAQVASTRAEIAALESEILQAETEVDTAQVDLAYTQINAPIDGVVVDVVTKEGQTIISAQTVPTILTLAVLDTVTVKAEISEADVAKVRPGLEVSFTTLGNATRHHGTLQAIEPGPTIDISDSTSAASAEAIYYNGLFDVANTDHALRIGMTAQVRIILARAQDVLSIPVSALGPADGEGRHTVSVLRDGMSRKAVIRTGLTDKVHVQVLEGLADGDQIIIGDSGAGDLPVENATGRPRRGGM